MNNIKYFTNENSIVRKIWGKDDTILFLFGACAAEFALNKSVDWLYFTGKLPNDPLGRLFSTVEYARMIVFATEEQAHQTIDHIKKIHEHVEDARQSKIPDWAYRDVLFMLIDYSIGSYELLERVLTIEEKKEVFTIFNFVGLRMGLKDLPESYSQFIHDRKKHLESNLQYGNFTKDLFQQYKKHLGSFRYYLMLLVQNSMCHSIVKKQLNLKLGMVSLTLIQLYKISRELNIDIILKQQFLPDEYKERIKALNV